MIQTNVNIPRMLVGEQIQLGSAAWASCVTERGTSSRSRYAHERLANVLRRLSYSYATKRPIVPDAALGTRDISGRC